MITIGSYVLFFIFSNIDWLKVHIYKIYHGETVKTNANHISILRIVLAVGAKGVPFGMVDKFIRLQEQVIFFLRSGGRRMSWLVFFQDTV